MLVPKFESTRGKLSWWFSEEEKEGFSEEENQLEEGEIKEDGVNFKHNPDVSSNEHERDGKLEDVSSDDETSDNRVSQRKWVDDMEDDIKVVNEM